MKKEYPFLSKAPIIEAVLDIRTTPAGKWEENSISGKIKSAYGSGYSFESENTFLFKLEFPESLPIPDNIPEPGWSGMRLTSGDKSEIIQVKRDTYVYSRVQLYPGWDSFKEKALSGWNSYRNITGRQNIKRIGIRFINRIDFTDNELPELLNVYPVQIGKIEKDITGYLLQNVYAYEKGKYFANLIQTVQPPENPDGKPSLIIDIDVYTSDGYPINEEDVESCIEKIRIFKNDLFFGAASEKLIERLK